MSLAMAWGLVADVDIESEKMRRLGETRFVLGQSLDCASCVHQHKHASILLQFSHKTEVVINWSLLKS